MKHRLLLTINFFFFFSATTQVQILLKSFITALRDHPALSSTTILWCCERNMAHEAGWTALYLQQNFNNIELIAQDGGDDYGWWTTEKEKIAYATASNLILSVGNIAYMKDPICTNPWLKKGDKTKDVKEKLQLQLTNYSPKLKPGKNTQNKNDLAFNFTFNLYLFSQFLLRKLPGLPYNKLLNTQ